jgi:hypothetical protein
MAASGSSVLVTSAIRFRGERRAVLVANTGDLAAVESALAARPATEEAAFVYGLASAAAVAARAPSGWESLGPVPALVRPLRLSAVSGLLPRVPLLAPFGRKRRAGVREISDLPADVRITRLWDRFSVDIGVALERTTKLFAWRIHERPDSAYRVFIFEDGDRYAIRALCIFTMQGHVLELLHDRSVTGMRAASHLLGLALREMSDAGTESARAISLPHSGSYPIFARHAFFAAKDERVIGVRPLDPEVEDTVLARDRWYVSYLDALDV